MNSKVSHKEALEKKYRPLQQIDLSFVQFGPTLHKSLQVSLDKELFKTKQNAHKSTAHICTCPKDRMQSLIQKANSSREEVCAPSAVFFFKRKPML